jgi:hypothetical protein
LQATPSSIRLKTDRFARRHRLPGTCYDVDLHDNRCQIARDAVDLAHGIHALQRAFAVVIGDQWGGLRVIGA